jgi:hypothetical protein
MAIVKYYREILWLSIKRAWTTGECLTSIFLLIAGLVLRYVPRWGATVKDYQLAIPVVVFLVILVIRLIKIPYEQHKTIEKLQTEQAQKKLDLKQKIRTFLESVTPKFLPAIDSGQTDIHVWFTTRQEMKLLNLSEEYIDFNKYLSFQKRMDAKFSNELNNPKDLINDPNDFGYFNETQNYRVYPKDALKK